MRFLDARLSPHRTKRGNKLPGMEIIPLVLVLLCTPWLTATVELRIPGLGKMNLEFIRETIAPGGLESPTEGQKTADDQTTLSSQATQRPANEKVTSDKPGNQTDVVGADPTPKVGSEAVTEGTTKGLQENAKSTVKENEKTAQAGKAEPNATTEAVTKAEPEKVDATTQAQAPAKNTANKEVKEEPAATTVKTSEATTEATTVKEEQKQNEKVTTPSPGKKLDATTTAKPATEEDDDFDMSDIWKDVEDPSNEFGREYDVDPKLLDSGNNNALGGGDDFQPKLELPPDMTQDMFYDVPSNNGTKPVEPDEGGFFDRLKKIFSIRNLIEQLDTIPGKVQSLMDQFRQKKSDGLRNLREKLDSSAESIGNAISEALAKLKKPKQKIPPECLGRNQENFKQYEAALQDGIEPCLEKAQSVFGKQDGVLKGAMERFSQTLSDMLGCAKKLEGATIDTLVTSIVNMGTCTKNNIQSKIEQALQPQIKRLSELIQHQGRTLKGNIDAAGECIGRKLQLSKFQKQRVDLIAEGKKCLEKRE